MAFGLPLAQHAATVALNLALAIAVGAALSAWWMAAGDSPWASEQGRRLRFAGLAALPVAMLASACLLWLEAASMAEVPVTQAAAAAWSMLTATHLGTAWMIGIGALVFSMAASLGGRRIARLNLLGLAVFLYTRSMVSHASANGDFGALITADWLHQLLACAWVGEVIVAGFLTLASPAGARSDDRHDRARYIASLSTSATVALAGIIATGLFGAWHNLGSPAALTATPYGTTLLVKLALVMLAAMLGGFNRFFVMPSLLAGLGRGGDGALHPGRRFTLILRIESAVLLGVLMLAAVLSSTSPPTSG